VKKVLLVGESWVIHMIHQKGFDSFTTTEYHRAATEFKAALEGGGWTVNHIPAHQIELDFPTDKSGLAEYDLVVISDVGANSFLLTKEVFSRGISEVNRLQLLKDYVLDGGGLLMVGGYLSFAGIDGRARYAESPLADILPVGVSSRDDRQERPESVLPVVVKPDHPALGGVGIQWPGLLGYNCTKALDTADVLVTVDEHPLISVREVGKGRTAVFTSDMAPHWAPPPFLEWAGYSVMWRALSTWVGGK
jgi:uncharacterized membrane protein